MSINSFTQYHYYYVLLMPYPEGMQMCSLKNSPLQWEVILWAHLSRGMIDCDWLNCPEKRAIHLVNDMPPGRKWPENLAAFHTVKKQGWGRLRSSELCLVAAALLPQTAIGPHKQPIVTQPHDIASPWVLIRRGCMYTSSLQMNVKTDQADLNAKSNEQ